MSVCFWGKFVFIFVIKVCFLLIYINLKNKVCLLKIQPSGSLLVITDSSINPHFIVKEMGPGRVSDFLFKKQINNRGQDKRTRSQSGGKDTRTSNTRPCGGHSC